MPPQMEFARVSQSNWLYPTKLSVCSRCLLKLQKRHISSTPTLRTRLRQDLFRWLEGPGKPLRYPLPRSTNYLSDYDEAGALLRTQGEDSKVTQEDGQNVVSSDEALPRETGSDLMPFPNNRAFKSQKVLSDELKDEIYNRVVEDGHDVRTVSADLQV